MSIATRHAEEDRPVACKPHVSCRRRNGDVRCYKDDDECASREAAYSQRTTSLFPLPFTNLAEAVLLTDKEVGSARKAGARDACNLCCQTFLVLCASLTCLDGDVSCRGEPGLIQLRLLDKETREIGMEASLVDTAASKARKFPDADAGSRPALS